jgi:hypothetical protein
MLPGMIAAAVIRRAVENQQDVLSAISAGQDVEEGLKARSIRGWHDQIDASAILGGDRAVQIDVFADELGGHFGPRTHRCPAGPYPIHAAEARFIGKHDAQASSAPSGSPPGFPHSVRKAVFLKAFCAARSRLG